jgi:hypothetical protein
MLELVLIANTFHLADRAGTATILTLPVPKTCAAAD